MKGRKMANLKSINLHTSRRINSRRGKNHKSLPISKGKNAGHFKGGGVKKRFDAYEKQEETRQKNTLNLTA